MHLLNFEPLLVEHGEQVNGQHFLIGEFRMLVVGEPLTAVFKTTFVHVTDIQIDSNKLFSFSLGNHA